MVWNLAVLLLDLCSWINYLVTSFSYVFKTSGIGDYTYPNNKQVIWVINAWLILGNLVALLSIFFIFLFWYHFRFQKSSNNSKEFLYTLYLDFPNVNILPHLLFSQFFSKLLENKLQTWFLFTPKYFSVHILNIYLYWYGLMDSYFIQWVISFYYYLIILINYNLL